MMCRGRTELAVLPRGGDLAQHVLVEVALGVAVLHRHVVDGVHHLSQQPGGGDGEARVLHVVGVGGAVAAQGAQEGEDVLAHHREHLGRGQVLEASPAQILVRAALGVCALGENAVLYGALEAVGLALLQGVQLVEAADEKQIGELLNHLERV